MKVTAEFKNDNGHVIVAEFDRDAQTVTTPDGKIGAYTREGPKQLKIGGDHNLTLAFEEEVQFQPGFSTRYTGSTGDGVVTILSVS